MPSNSRARIEFILWSKRTASYCSECTVQCTADATSAARASRIIADMTNYDADDKKRD